MTVASAGWITFAAFVLSVLAMGLPFWSHAPPSGDMSISVGLWQFCVHVHSKAIHACPSPILETECFWLHSINKSPYSSAGLCSLRRRDRALDNFAALTCDAQGASKFLQWSCSGGSVASAVFAVVGIAVVATSFVVGFVCRDRDYAGPRVPVPTMWPTALLSSACATSIATIILWAIHAPSSTSFSWGFLLQTAAFGLLLGALGVEMTEVKALGGFNRCSKLCLLVQMWF